MNKEDKIKSFLVNIKGNDEWKEIYDYITNLQTIEQQYSAILSENAELQEENKKLQKRNKEIYDGFIATQEELSDYATINEKAKSLTNRTIEIIKQQPSGNDEWILERLNGINYCLGGDENE